MSPRHALYRAAGRPVAASIHLEQGTWKARVDGRWLTGRFESPEGAQKKIELLLGREGLQVRVLRAVVRQDASHRQSLAKYLHRSIRAVDYAVGCLVEQGRLLRIGYGRVQLTERGLDAALAAMPARVARP